MQAGKCTYRQTTKLTLVEITCVLLTKLNRVKGGGTVRAHDGQLSRTVRESYQMTLTKLKGTVLSAYRFQEVDGQGFRRNRKKPENHLHQVSKYASRP